MFNLLGSAAIGVVSGLGLEAAKRRGWLDFLGADGADDVAVTRDVLGYVVSGDATPLAARVDRAIALVKGGDRATVERNLRAVDPTARVIARVVLALPDFYWGDPASSPETSAEKPAPVGSDCAGDCAGPGHCECDACTAAVGAVQQRPPPPPPPQRPPPQRPPPPIEAPPPIETPPIYEDDLPGDDMGDEVDLPGELDCDDDVLDLDCDFPGGQPADEPGNCYDVDQTGDELDYYDEGSVLDEQYDPGWAHLLEPQEPCMTGCPR